MASTTKDGTGIVPPEGKIGYAADPKHNNLGSMETPRDRTKLNPRKYPVVTRTPPNDSLKENTTKFGDDPPVASGKRPHETT